MNKTELVAAMADQAGLSKKLYQSVLHTDCSHAYDTKTFYSNTSCISSNNIRINNDLAQAGIYTSFHMVYLH